MKEPKNLKKSWKYGIIKSRTLWFLLLFGENIKYKILYNTYEKTIISAEQNN